MFLCGAFLALLLLPISSVHASPFRTAASTGKISLSVAAKVKARGMTNIAEADRARVKALREGRLNKRDVMVGITNGQAVYTAKVGIGSPPKECECLEMTRIPLYFLKLTRDRHATY